MHAKRSKYILATVVSCLTTCPVAAQESGAAASSAPPSATGSALPSADLGITDVIVSANRRDERQREVANSVTAIVGEDLTRRQEVRLQDLVGQVPGLSVEDDSPVLARIVIRGINSGGAGATVATVVDDVPTNTAGSQNQGASITPNFDTYDLRRVEVLRGPQSSLYGATAEGGLIKYVTNPPDLRHYSGAVEAGIDGITVGTVGGSLKGYVNIPLIENVAALRVTAATEWIPGYIDDPERGKTDINSGQQYSWRASLLMKPSEALSVRLFASRQSIFTNDDNSVQVRGAALTPLTPPANQLEPLDPLQKNVRFPSIAQAETGVYYGEVSYDTGFATLTSLTSYVFDDFSGNINLTETNLSPGLTYSSGLIAPIYGVAGEFVGRQHANTGKFNQEVRVSSDPGSDVAGYGFDWQAGAFYTHESETRSEIYDARSPTAPYAILAGPPLGGDAISASYTEWAIFGQVTLHITPSVSVDLGGRYSGNDQHSQTKEFCCVLLGPTTTVLPATSANDHDALYSVAPKWKVDDDTTAYVRIATGFRPGGPNLPIGGAPQAPTRYGSDRTVNYEIGLRRDFLDKTVQVDVTGYYIDWKQIQIVSLFQTSSGQVGVIGNAGAATSKGVEWSLAWQPIGGLKFGVVGGFTDARLTENAPGLGARDGDYLPYVPDVTNSVNVDYSWNVFEDYEAYVSGTWTYVGPRYTGFTPLTYVATSHVRLPSYNTGSLRAGIENDRYGAEIFINNVSDERAVTVYANSGGANETGLGNLTQPRLIGATLRVKF